jgi:hypothetical protein
MVDTVIPATAFQDVPQTTPGDPLTQAIALNQQPGIVAPDLTPINTPATTIRNAIASDKAANTSGTTPADPPDNFDFRDFTVNVGGTIPGDVFKGGQTTPGVQFQFLDLTPDNIGIIGKGPNLFMKTDEGNDFMVAQGGRNIMSAGSGINTFVAAAGQDTMLVDATNANASATVLNFKAGDDVAVLGINASDFSFLLHETPFGLSLDVVPSAGVLEKHTAAITLEGFTTQDIGTKLSLGISATTDGTNFLFVHAN